MKYVCPRCKNPAPDHAPYRSFCPLTEKEVLYLIIELQAVTLKKYEEDHQLLESINFFLRERGWVDFGFNGATTYQNPTDDTLTESDDEYYIDSDNYAPTLREAIDKWLVFQRSKEDSVD